MFQHSIQSELSFGNLISFSLFERPNHTSFALIYLIFLQFTELTNRHCFTIKAKKMEAQAEPEHIAKSPSDFSCHSYELFVGQEKGNDDNNKEKMSIRSEGLESVSEITRTTAPTAIASAKVRKASTVSMSECFA